MEVLLPALTSAFWTVLAQQVLELDVRDRTEGAGWRQPAGMGDLCSSGDDGFLTLPWKSWPGTWCTHHTSFLQGVEPRPQACRSQGMLQRRVYFIYFTLFVETDSRPPVFELHSLIRNVLSFLFYWLASNREGPPFLQSQVLQLNVTDSIVWRALHWAYTLHCRVLSKIHNLCPPGALGTLLLLPYPTLSQGLCLPLPVEGTAVKITGPSNGSQLWPLWGADGLGVVGAAWSHQGWQCPKPYI